MAFSRRLLESVNVRPGEERTTSLLLAHSFFMGLSTTFFETAASALFLERFGAGKLPFVYLLAAALNTATGAVYTAVQRRASFRSLMAGTLAFLLVTTVLLRAGLAVSGAAWLVFGLLVWYRAISALTDLEYWAVAAHLFDVRQAKRLFGLVGTGEVVARIGGSFAVPLLVTLTGVPNLLVLSAAALLACLCLALALLRRSGPREGPRPRAVEAPRSTWAETRSLLADRYLLLIFALSFFGVLAKYFVDFAFLAEMRSRYGGAKQLASFFAVFSGVSQVLSLLTRLFVSGRVLGKHGIQVGLLVLPLAQVACTLAIVAAGFLPGAAVFWLVIANQGIYKTLKHPIDNPSFKVLYQPLRKERRLGTQIAVETLVTPLTIGLAGAVMLLFSSVVRYDPVVFAFVMLLTFGGWLATAVRAGRAYAGALKEALKGRIDDDHAVLLFSDEASLDILRQRLASPRPEEVLPALDLLEKTEHPSLGKVLEGLLAHPAAEVRRAVLSRLERLRPPGVVPAVSRVLEGDRSSSVRAAALRCLCALESRDAGKLLTPFLGHGNAEIRRAATVGLLLAGQPSALEALGARAASAQPADRLWVAQVVGETALPTLHPVLATLLADPDWDVRRAALAAAGRLRAPELWPAVARHLEDRRFAGAAGRALGCGSDQALGPLLEVHGRARKPFVRAQVARVLGRIRTPRAVDLLWSWSDEREILVRQEVLEALRRCGFRAEGERAASVLARVESEVAEAAWKLGLLRDLASSPGMPLLCAALEGELAAARSRLFLLLSFVRDAEAVMRAREGLESESRDRRAYALEMLDVTLGGELRPLVMPLVEGLSVAKACEALEARFPQPRRSRDERLREILAVPPGRLTPWTVAGALMAAFELGLEDASLSPEALQGTLLKQTAAHFASLRGEVEAIGAAAAGRRRPMLTIEKVILLKSVQMFAATSDGILADVASIVEEVEVGAGEVVFRKGEVGDCMYVIVEGRVRVFDGENVISTLGQRDIFGELALLDPEPRLASVAAEIPTRLLRLDREAFLELMEGNIEVVRGVLHVLCERLREVMAGRSAPEPPGRVGYAR